MVKDYRLGPRCHEIFTEISSLSVRLTLSRLRLCEIRLSTTYHPEGSIMLKYIARIVAVSLLTVSSTMVFAQSGADTYKSKCQMCHAADGSGNTPAGKSTKARPFDSPEVLKLSDDDLVKVTKSGQGKM